MLSASHLIIVFLVALLVFGPEKLPELARTLSKTMGDFRRVTGDFQETIQREMQQLEREAREHSQAKQQASLPASTAESEASVHSENGLHESEPSHPGEFTPPGSEEASGSEEAMAQGGEAARDGEGADLPDIDEPVNTSEVPTYEDSYYDAAVAKEPGNQWPEESPEASPETQSTGSSQAASAADTRPAADSPETVNSSAQQESPSTAGAEKPVNDHPTAA